MHSNSTKPTPAQTSPAPEAIKAASPDGKRQFENNEPNPNPNKPPATIRGGFVVIRRDDRTGRLITLGKTPYEHASSKEAQPQAAVLAARLGSEFAVFCEVASALPPETVESELAEVTKPTPAGAPIETSAKRTVIVERRVSRSRKPVGAA